MITVTTKAKTYLSSLKADSGLGPEAGLRVAVVGGGCSGLQYHLEFKDAPSPGDLAFDAGDGVWLYVDRKSFLYLSGTELDYDGGLNGKGFAFNNPNAQRTCGCGTSFGM
jgi:iron-sulfur cluster assembly protein